MKNKKEKKNRLFSYKLRFSFVKKRLKKFYKTYFTLPHIWVFIIIFFLSLITLIIAVYYHESNSLASSIYANIFAGLITGLVISFVSLIKGMSLYKTQSQLDWLNGLHKQCLSFMKESRNLYFSKNNDYASEKERYDKIYGLLCLGNDISVSISQGQYDETKPFNTYKFCRKKLCFDSIDHEKKNAELREKIFHLDYHNISGTEIRNLFKEMEYSIGNLNSSINDRIRYLEIKIKAINMT